MGYFITLTVGGWITAVLDHKTYLPAEFSKGKRDIGGAAGRLGKFKRKKQINCPLFKNRIMGKGAHLESLFWGCKRGRDNIGRCCPCPQSKKTKSESGKINHIQRQAFAKLPKVMGMFFILTGVFDTWI